MNESKAFHKVKLPSGWGQGDISYLSPSICIRPITFENRLQELLRQLHVTPTIDPTTMANSLILFGRDGFRAQLLYWQTVGQLVDCLSHVQEE